MEECTFSKVAGYHILKMLIIAKKNRLQLDFYPAVKIFG